MTEPKEPSFQDQIDDVIAGITAAGNLEPYSNELLRTAYLGASALIDGNETLKPVEQMTHRKGIAELAGKLATEHEDETTAAEMAARVKDCDNILKLIKPQADAGKPAAKATASKPKKASTAAAKTSGAKSS
jgi:hypothetical protein